MDWVDFFRTQSREFTVTRGLKSVSGEALPEWWETSSWLTERLRCPSPDCWARASSLPFNEQFEHRLYIYFSINDPRGKPRAHAHSEPWFPSGAELLLECLVTNKNVTVLLGKWVMTERLKDWKTPQFLKWKSWLSAHATFTAPRKCYLQLGIKIKRKYLL